MTGTVIIYTGPKPQPRGFSGPASLQMVDEITKRTLLTVQGIGPIDLPKFFGA